MRVSFFLLAFALLAAGSLAQNYCGRDYADAKKCQIACPGGLDGECPMGEACFASVPCSSGSMYAAESMGQNYCGRDYADAKKCQISCPGGLDGECPLGEACFASVPCSESLSELSTSEQCAEAYAAAESGAQNYCGRDFADAKKCETACPRGIDGECPAGERCFASVPCASGLSQLLTSEQCAEAAVAESGAQNYCGRNYADSKKCQTGCPRGTDGECPSGERCFASVPCSSGPSQPSTSSQCGRTYADAKQCRTPCPSNTNRECAPGETCYASVPCAGPSPPGPPGPPGPPSPPGSIPVSEGQFNRMFPNKIGFYSYPGFRAAAATFPGFMKTGSSDVQKREAAAFLANIAHESGDLRYIREINQANWPHYCNERTALANGFTRDCRKHGRQFQYYGRGPIQLSWNFNYLSAGRAMGVDLINNPDKVATDSTVAWRTAIWFWMNERGAGTMIPHNAIVNGHGFGQTIRSINGALECDGKLPAIVDKRVSYYRRFVQILGTSVGPGNIRC